MAVSCHRIIVLRKFGSIRVCRISTSCLQHSLQAFEAELGQVLHLIGVYHVVEQPAESTLFKYPVMRDPYASMAVLGVALPCLFLQVCTLIFWTCYGWSGLGDHAALLQGDREDGQLWGREPDRRFSWEWFYVDFLVESCRSYVAVTSCYCLKKKQELGSLCSFAPRISTSSDA